MKKIISLFALVAAFSCGQGKQVTPEVKPDPDPEQKPVVEEPEEPSAVQTPAFALGADISWASEMEAGGRTFKKADGTQAPLLDVLKESGVNAIRLRVWVNPYKGWSGKEDVVAVAKKVSAAGMALMVDFHYSDFFADPERQLVPSAWKDASLEQMCSYVSAHTKDVLQALKEAKADVHWVQIGNETRGGMIYPAGALDYKSKGSEFAQFIKLYKAGYEAAKEVYPSALVMFHLNNAYDTNNNNWWISNFKNQGGVFDAIALSHYPQDESDAAKCNTQALNNIKTLYNTYKVPVYVAEVGVYQGNASAVSVLSGFMAEVRKLDGCKGVFYWEPEVDGSWKPELYGNVAELRKYSGDATTGTWGAYPKGAFTTGGQPSDVFKAFVN